MKCPKCGYVSFDHLQNCKKCGDDLTAHKSRYKVGTFAAPKAPPLPPADPIKATPPSPTEVSADNGRNLEFSFTAANSAPAAGDLPGPLRSPKPAATIATQDTFLEESPADALLAALADAFPPAGDSPSTDPVSDFSFDAPFPPPPPERPAVTDEFLFSTPPAGEAASPGETPEFAFDRQQEPQFSFTGGGSAVGRDAGEERSPAEREEEALVSAAPERPSLFDFPAREAGDPTRCALPEKQGPVLAAPAEEKRPPLPPDDFDRIDSSLGDLPSPRPADPLPYTGDDPLTGNSAEEGHDSWTDPTEYPPGMWPDSPGEVPPDEGFSFPRQEIATPLWRRLAASLTDGLILGMVFFLFVLAAEAAIGGTRPIAESILALAAPYFLVFFCLSFGYFTLFHFLMGQTLGKILFRLQVAGSGGESLLLSQAFLRTAGGLLSLLPAGLGFLVIPFDRQGRGWNDRLAGTRVIPVGPRVSPDRPPAEMESEEPLATEGIGTGD